MLGLSLAVLPLFITPYVADLPPAMDRAFWLAGIVIYFAFVAELVVMTYLAPDRVGHLRRHWYEVPIVVVPFLRPLRVLRSARALRALRAMRLLAFATRASGAVQYVLQRHGLQYVLLGGAVLYVLSAAMVTVFERESGGNIHTFPDALWWGVTTMASLRNDDAFPVTRAGRFVAVFVALLGLSLVSIITANIAAFLLRGDRRDQAAIDDVLLQLQRIETQLASLTERIAPDTRAQHDNGRDPDLQSIPASPGTP